jgi:hypothetical protein
MENENITLADKIRITWKYMPLWAKIADCTIAAGILLALGLGIFL